MLLYLESGEKALLRHLELSWINSNTTWDLAYKFDWYLNLLEFAIIFFHWDTHSTRREEFVDCNCEINGSFQVV